MNELEDTNTTVTAANQRTRRKSTVLHSYNAKSMNEVTVTEGDMITIVEDDPNLEWTLIEVRGKKGYIPTNYLKRLAAGEAADKEGSGGGGGRGGEHAAGEGNGADDVGLTASVLGWQSSTTRMPNNVQGLLQKKNLSTNEVARVREMMQMLSSTTSGVSIGEETIIQGIGARGRSEEDEDAVRSSHPQARESTGSACNAQYEGSVTWWSVKNRQWLYGCLTLDGNTLTCLTSDDGGKDDDSSRGTSNVNWKVLLTSYCEVERIRTPTSLEDLADDSSDDSDDEGRPPGVSSTLYCLRVSKYKEEASGEIINVAETSSSLLLCDYIIACKKELHIMEWKMKIQCAIDSAMESELDQLMIFADGSDGSLPSKSVLSTIASKTKSILSRGREQLRGSVSFQYISFLIYCLVAVYFGTLVLICCCCCCFFFFLVFFSLVFFSLVFFSCFLLGLSFIPPSSLIPFTSVQ